MRKFSPVFLTSALLLGLTLVGCQKEIQLDLREAATKYVLEGNLDDSTGFNLRITQSKPFYDDNTFNPISTASVVVSDDAGNSYTIPYDTSGFYIDTNLKAVVGRTYTVQVNDNGNEFVSSATVPQKTLIKKVTVGSINFGGGQNGPGIVRFLQVWYDENPGAGNHYRVIYKNPKDPLSSLGINLQDDRFGDGIETQILIFGGTDDEEAKLEIGDTVSVSLQSIDKAAYDYLYTLDLISTDRGGGAITPTDPTSNWSNKALGVFIATTVDGKSVIIDK